MAIYRCEIKTVSRKQGRNVVAAAAYRAGVMLSDMCDFFNKEHRRHDYTRRGGVVASGIMLPDGVPALFADRQTLWNAQERAENRKNSRVAREAIISLPHELTDKQRHKAVMRYAQHIINRYGVACDYAIHRPDRKADSRNHHAHILFTTRRMTADGLGEKTRELDDKAAGAEEIRHMRKSWENICNDALLQAKKVARVDCRSLKDRGINRLPEPKQGAVATQMERQGRVSHAGKERRAVKAYNDALAMMEGEEQRQHPRAVTDRCRGQNGVTTHQTHQPTPCALALQADAVLSAGVVAPETGDTVRAAIISDMAACQAYGDSAGRGRIRDRVSGSQDRHRADL